MTVVFISNNNVIQSLCDFIEGLISYIQENNHMILIAPSGEHIDQNYLIDSHKTIAQCGSIF